MDRKQFLRIVLTLTGTSFVACSGEDDMTGDAAEGGEGGTAPPTGGIGGAPDGGTSGSSGVTNGGTGATLGKGGTGTGGEGVSGAGAGGAGDGGTGRGGTAGIGRGGDGIGGVGAGGAGKGGAGAGDAGGGSGGTGTGGTGGGGMCTSGPGGNLGVFHVGGGPGDLTHTHLTGPNGTLSTAIELVAQINAGTPMSFTVPNDGAPAHAHVLTFTAQEYQSLRNGGYVLKLTSPDDSGHFHQFGIECIP